MKKFFCITILILSCLGLTAQIPEWLWAVQAGGTGDQNCNDCTTDSQGNVYVTGMFYGTASFGPYVLNSTGGPDLYVAKLDPEGNWLWAVRAGNSVSASVTTGNGIAVDGSGNVYVGGGGLKHF